MIWSTLFNILISERGIMIVWPFKNDRLNSEKHSNIFYIESISSITDSQLKGKASSRACFKAVIYSYK